MDKPTTETDGPLYERFAIKAAIDPDGVQARHRFAPLPHSLEDFFAPVTLTRTSGCDPQAQDQSQRIDSDELLASFNPMDWDTALLRCECNERDGHGCLTKFRLCANCENRCTPFAMLKSHLVKIATALLRPRCRRSRSRLPKDRLLAMPSALRSTRKTPKLGSPDLLSRGGKAILRL